MLVIEVLKTFADVQFTFQFLASVQRLVESLAINLRDASVLVFAVLLVFKQRELDFPYDR